MSNNNGPFGFREAGRLDGAPYNAGVFAGQMLAAAPAAYYGDPLVMSGGYVQQASAEINGGEQLAGHAVSFSWISISQKGRVWNDYWPGNDAVAGSTVDVKMIVDPFAKLAVQASAGPITQANVGQFANFAVGAGNTANGISGYSLDTTTLSNVQGNLPYKIVDIVQAPASDPTSAYNVVRVQCVNLNAGI